MGTHSQHTLQQRSTSNTTLQIRDLRTRFVDVETSNDDQFRRSGEISNRNWDLRHDVFYEGVDVVTELSGDGDNGSGIGDGSFDKCED